MVGGSREEMLSRIRSALGTDRGRPPDAGSHSAASRTGNNQAKQSKESIHIPRDVRRAALKDQFVSELTRIGGKVHLAQDPESACLYLSELIASTGNKSVVAWEETSRQSSSILSLLEAHGVRVIEDGEGTDRDLFLREAARAGLGITGVDYALADTATLVLLSGKGRARSVSLLPPVHVALLDSNKIVSGLDEFFSVCGYESGSDGRNLPSAITFITGPSRTADIELTLVVGVHGPQELHVVLMES
ncbi:MAG TPA: lactate utilization protein [Blastocatellia bacterium]|nr:lactate utilization protein [Blastocatellia bacterium]